MRCGCFGWPHCGHRFRRGAEILCWARRLSRRDLDCFFFGTVTAADYSEGSERDLARCAERLQERPVVRYEDDGARVDGERGLELFDRGQVEVVRGLVEDEAVDALRGQQRELRAGPLARREGSRGPKDVVRTEAELGEERARLLLLPAERVDERLVHGEACARLLHPAEDDALSHFARARRERQLPRERAEKRRLAASVRAGQRQPVAARELEVDGPKPENAALDDRTREAGARRPKPVNPGAAPPRLDAGPGPPASAPRGRPRAAAPREGPVLDGA